MPIDGLQMYAVGVIALWSYDYLLTLEDEIEYAWKTKNMLSKRRLDWHVNEQG
jgi:hypothetical protein